MLRAYAAKKRAELAARRGDAARQMQAVTDERAVHALDRALTAPPVAPEAGAPIPGPQPDLRECADHVDDVRVIQYVTALRAVIAVGCVEA
ncbi:hypothetical protein [Streptomyces sp. B8F3]|uniref:hypothetical protein n=1 Tax=unclassified Streptomyces TaxID=2593676 RepID=UPI00325CB041